MAPNDGYIVNPLSLDDNGDPIDMMGIIARNNISVATSVEFRWQSIIMLTDPDINIDGGIFCMDGGFHCAGFK